MCIRDRVEPERAGPKALAIGPAELGRLGDEAPDGEALTIDAQHLPEQQRGLAAEKRPAASVADGNAVLEQHHADVRVERPSPGGADREERDRRAAREVVPAHAFKIRCLLYT